MNCVYPLECKTIKHFCWPASSYSHILSLLFALSISPSLFIGLSVTLVHLSLLSPFLVSYLSNFCSFSVQVCHNYPELRPPIMPLAIPSHSVPCYIHILSHVHRRWPLHCSHPIMSLRCSFTILLYCSYPTMLCPCSSSVMSEYYSLSY